MKHTRIAIVGAGAVGTTTAFALMMRNLVPEILVADVDAKRLEGEVRDLADALSFTRTATIKMATLKEAAQANIIIITAGKRQAPGQTRAELVAANRGIVKEIIEGMKPIAKEAIIIMVTNPVEVLTKVAYDVAGLPAAQIFGSGTLLDTCRLRRFLAQILGIDEQSIHAYVLGEHGDAQFVAWSCAHVGGKPLTSFGQLTKETLDRLEVKTKNEVYEIIERKCATFFGVAACVSALCENIIFNQSRIVPVSCLIKERNVFVNMPVVLSAKGIERIIDIPLNATEKEKLAQAIAQIKALNGAQ